MYFEFFGWKKKAKKEKISFCVCLWQLGRS